MSQNFKLVDVIRGKKIAPGQLPEVNKCSNCGSPCPNSAAWCDVCNTLYNAITGQPGLLAAHNEWKIENNRRVALKQRTLNGEDNAHN